MLADKTDGEPATYRVSGTLCAAGGALQGGSGTVTQASNGWEVGRVGVWWGGTGLGRAGGGQGEGEKEEGRCLRGSVGQGRDVQDEAHLCSVRDAAVLVCLTDEWQTDA